MFNEPSEGLLSAKYTRPCDARARKRRREKSRESLVRLVYLGGDRVHRVDDEHGDGRVEDQVEAEALTEEAGQVFEELEVVRDRAEVEAAREASGVAEYE